MNAHHRRTLVAPLVLANLVVVFPAWLAPSRVGAQICPSATALTSNVSVLATSDPKVYSISPGLARWSAVGVRRADAANWDIEARNSTAAFPTCYSGVLANSAAASGIDLLVTDWRFRSPETDYVGVGTTLLNGSAARVEYEQAFFEYRINDVQDQVFFGADDVLSVREVPLTATGHYSIIVWPSVGATGLKCYIFAPITSGNGWANKSARVVEQTLVAGSGNPIDVVAGASGMFAIVITNENGVAGNFYISIKNCPQGASPLTDNVPRVTVKAEEYASFLPPAHTWNAVGVRGDIGYGYNWDVAPGFRLPFWFDWTCSDSVLAQQSSGLGARVIVGDFRSSPLRVYTAHASLEQQPKTTSFGYLEWEDGQDALVVNAPFTAVSPPANNVIDAWCVNLVMSGTYTFSLIPNGGATANYKILVFANPSPGAPYWATRPDAVAQISGAGAYTPSATGLYSVVVVNDDGGTGGYQIGVTSTLVGVDPGVPGAAGLSRIRAVTPNPSFAGARIDYELAHAGQASLRVTDVAGRLVADVAATSHDAGPASLAWSGRADGGARPPAGVYFITLYLDDLAQDRAKMIVLR